MRKLKKVARKRNPKPAAKLRRILYGVMKLGVDGFARKEKIAVAGVLATIRGAPARRMMVQIREAVAVEEYMQGKRASPDVERGEWDGRSQRSVEWQKKHATA